MKTIDIYKTLLVSVVMFIMAGCAGSQSNVNPKTGKAYTEKEYKIILDRKNYENSIHPIAKIALNQNSKVIGTMLIEPGNDILYTISMPSVKYVHEVKLSENLHLNIDRVLVDHSDYFWDSVRRELLIKFNVPHIYLLHGEVKFKLNIIIEDDKKRVSNMQRYFVFWHKPMKENDESYMSFEYLNNYDNIQDVDRFMRKEINQEKQRLDTNRISPTYNSKVKGLR